MPINIPLPPNFNLQMLYENWLRQQLLQLSMHDQGGCPKWMEPKTSKQSARTAKTSGC